MFDYSKLKGRMRECGITQERLAESIGVSSVAMSEKLNNKRGFRQEEMRKAIEVLEIESDEVSAYFFTLKV